MRGIISRALPRQLSGHTGRRCSVNSDSRSIISRLFPAALLSALILITKINVTLASEATAAGTTTAGSVDYSDVDLHELTDEELAAICTNRGFELVVEVDDATGEPLSYTHDDYVDAAKECLQLEAEMEEFYDENPNLLGELEAERERMIKENEDLERQLKETQERLASERDEANEKEQSAFVHTESLGEEKKAEDIKPAASNESDDSTKDTDKEQNRANDALKELLDDDDEIIDLDDEDVSSDGALKSKEGTEGSTPGEAPKAQEREVQKNQTSGEDKGIEPTSKQEGSGPLATLKLAKEVALEVRDRVRRDVTYVYDIVIPKPIRGPLKKFLRRAFNVGKATTISAAKNLKRYAIAFFKSAKAAYENRGQEDGNEKSENAVAAEQ